MSATYQKPFTLPEGFPALLKGFTREVLRSQPDDIYEFGARYFAGLLPAGDAYGGLSSKPDLQPKAAPVSNSGTPTQQQFDVSQLAAKGLTNAEMASIMKRLFAAADSNGNGTLDRKEFGAVLRHENLNLTERQVREVLAEADDNDDGVISYEEFMPVLLDLMQIIKAKEAAAAQHVDGGDGMEQLFRGRSQQQMEETMARIFAKADTDGSGKLSKREFKSALLKAGLGLTRKDLNLVMSVVDEDGDGQISYEEFVPVCFQVLCDRLKDDILSNQDALQTLLLEAFQGADEGGAGVLDQRVVKAVLQQLSYDVLGTTALQIVALLSQAPTVESGEIAYLQFIPDAAAMIRSFHDADALKLRMAAVREAAGSSAVGALRLIDLPTLRAGLEEAFAQADQDGSGSLSVEEATQILEAVAGDGGAGQDLGLDPVHVQAMFAAIDADDSGTVDCNELVSFIVDAVEHLDQDRLLQARLQRGREAQEGGEGENSYVKQGQEGQYEGEGEEEEAQEGEEY